MARNGNAKGGLDGGFLDTFGIEYNTRALLIDVLVGFALRIGSGTCAPRARALSSRPRRLQELSDG